MPFLQFYTTLPALRVPKDFQKKTALLLTQILKDKPMERICVHLFTDQNIYSGSDPDSKSPNAYAVLRSIGSVSADENRLTAQAMSTHVKKELGISDNDFRLFIMDLDPNLVATKSKICTDLGL